LELGEARERECLRNASSERGEQVGVRARLPGEAEQTWVRRGEQVGEGLPGEEESSTLGVLGVWKEMDMSQ
jgi:hypothetical protein